MTRTQAITQLLRMGYSQTEATRIADAGDSSAARAMPTPGDGGTPAAMAAIKTQDMDRQNRDERRTGRGGFAPQGQSIASAMMSAPDPLNPGGFHAAGRGRDYAAAPFEAQSPGAALGAVQAAYGRGEMTGHEATQAIRGIQQPGATRQGMGFMSGVGDFLGGLLNPEGASRTRVATALMKEGVPPNTAMLLASDKGLLRGYVQSRMSGTKPIVINDKLIDPSTGRVLGDYGDPEKPAAPISVGKDSRLFDPTTGQWIASPGADEMERPDFKDIAGVRKEIQSLPSYKNYAQAAPIWSSIVDAEGRDTKASDLNFIYGIGKLFDPGSVVREGEMVMVQSTANLPQRILAAISIVNSKGRLTPDMRSELLAEAQSRMNAYDDALRTDIRSYRGLARRYGVNPRDMIPRRAPMAESAPTTPGDPEPAPELEPGGFSPALQHGSMSPAPTRSGGRSGTTSSGIRWRLED
ncbi:hypothetical protein [Microbaculum marinisediminis]|uniref:UBA domain-containing protein n=1 Tax=Microbaculum marinisediminis TaxID=2931392 RepID=A0AAW5QSM0_9HYPH|nr:hypothetical protein [Microbaculum sp. A6E488]MCT8970877.1 hypothetical protein [Microbaculum sp. A6E488]